MKEGLGRENQRDDNMRTWVMLLALRMKRAVSHEAVHHEEGHKMSSKHLWIQEAVCSTPGMLLWSIDWRTASFEWSLEQEQALQCTQTMVQKTLLLWEIWSNTSWGTRVSLNELQLSPLEFWRKAMLYVSENYTTFKKLLTFYWTLLETESLTTVYQM